MRPDTNALLGAIVERLETIQKVLHNLSAAVDAAAKTDEEARQDNGETISHQVRLANAAEKKRSAEHKQNLCIQRVIGAGTWAAVIAASVYAFVAMSQLSIDRTSMQVGQRAYVSFQGMEFDNIVDRSTPQATMDFIFHASTVNTGNTPAQGVEQYFNIGDAEPSEKQFVGSPTRINLAIGGKALYTFGGGSEPASYFHLPNEYVSSQELKALRTQTGLPNRVFWGWVSYRDVFPKTPMHVTEFCQQLTNVVARANPNIGYQYVFNFQNCESGQHNCIDQNCPDYNSLADPNLNNSRS